LNQERRNNEFHSTKRRPENSKVLTKSKSSPDNGIHKIEKKENSFDKDFPILAPNKNTTTTSIRSSTTESVWRQEKLASETLVPKLFEVESTPVPSQTIRTSRSTEDFQLNYIKPTSSKLNGTKKIGGDSKARKEVVAQDLKLKKETNLLPSQDLKTKKKPVPINNMNFRKTVSEPTLPLDDPKILAVRNRFYSDPHCKGPQDRPRFTSKRDEFFEDLMRKEQEKAGINAKEDNDEESLDDSVGDSNKNSHISNLQLLKPKSPIITEPNETPFVKINPEDEERVLRLMGWRPEEEDHIPELTEEEIREIKSKMNLGKNKK